MRSHDQVPCVKCSAEAEFDSPDDLCEWHWHMWLSDGDAAVAANDMAAVALGPYENAPGWGLAHAGANRHSRRFVQ